MKTALFPLSLAAAVAVASPAQAQTFFGNFNGTIRDANTLTTDGVDFFTAVKVENAIFGDFNFDPVFFGDEVKIAFLISSDRYILDFGSEPFAEQLDGAFSYSLTGDQIVLPNGAVSATVFNSIQLDSDVGGDGVYEVAKEVITDESQVFNLLSINGDADSSGIFPTASSLVVTDTLTSNGDDITSLSNSFTTVQEFTPVSVPEPGTILGLLAFGGLGLAAKGKKQK